MNIDENIYDSNGFISDDKITSWNFFRITTNIRVYARSFSEGHVVTRDESETLEFMAREVSDLAYALADKCGLLDNEFNERRKIQNDTNIKTE